MHLKPWIVSPQHDCIAPSTAATYHRRRSKNKKWRSPKWRLCRCWNGVPELHRQSGICHSPDMTASPYVRRVAPSRKIKGEMKWGIRPDQGASSLTSCLGHEAAYHLPHSLDSLIECQILLRLRRRFCFRYA